MTTSPWLAILGRLIITYRIRWECRAVLVKQYGKQARQTDDLLGVILPNGRYIPYGYRYNTAYMAGRIR
jgi:hypothetical protein